MSGDGARAHDEAEAEWLVRTGLKALGVPLAVNELAGRGRFRGEKSLVAWWVRDRTPVSNRWLGERLAMGHPGSVSREVGRIRREPVLEKRARTLAGELSIVLNCED